MEPPMEKTIQTVQRKPYQSDLADEQWALLAPLIVLPEGGRQGHSDQQRKRLRCRKKNQGNQASFDG